jgi:hypothetical protein
MRFSRRAVGRVQRLFRSEFDHVIPPEIKGDRRLGQSADSPRNGYALFECVAIR